MLLTTVLPDLSYVLHGFPVLVARFPLFIILLLFLFLFGLVLLVLSRFSPLFLPPAVCVALTAQTVEALCTGAASLENVALVVEKAVVQTTPRLVHKLVVGVLRDQRGMNGQGEAFPLGHGFLRDALVEVRWLGGGRVQICRHIKELYGRGIQISGGRVEILSRFSSEVLHLLLPLFIGTTSATLSTSMEVDHVVIVVLILRLPCVRVPTWRCGGKQAVGDFFRRVRSRDRGRDGIIHAEERL